MALEDVGENMTKKMGPFPVWVWGVLIGGSFVLWYWVSQRDAGQSALADSVEDSEVGTVAPPSGDFDTVPIMPPSDGVVDEATNLEWSIQALNSVTGTGVSLLAAQTAISKYLNGQTLSSAEGKIIETILSKIGAPPEGVSTPDVTPGPKPPAAVNYATKTYLNGPSKVGILSTATLRLRTVWVNPKGHTSQPSGRIWTSSDGARSMATTLVNGFGIRTIIFGRGKTTADRRVVVKARFEPKKGTKALASEADPISIQLT